jgi:hypothetical protein
MLRIICLSCLLIFAAACGSGDKTPSAGDKLSAAATADSLKGGQSGSAASPETAVACDRGPVKDSTYSFMDDGFVAAALAQDLTRRTIDSLYAGGGSRKEKLSKNKYTAGEYDTTVSYQPDCDSVVYIASKVNAFPLYASWQSGRIALDSGFVKTGLSRDAFIQKFHLPATIPNVVRITETEGANIFTLVFAGGSLKRIVYNNLYVE